jgi:DNA-binding GntR family transcriptional regulator
VLTEALTEPTSKAALSRTVAEQLRHAIFTHQYKPGERLVEDRLSADLGVSRAPVREALRLLAAEGLVLLESRRGASVANSSDTVVREMVEVRAMLEGLNARLAARHRDPAVLGELRLVLAKGNAAAVRESAEELVQLNSEYHDLLAKCGQNSVLADILRGLRERTRLVFSQNSAGRAHDDWEEHSRILAAIVDGDEELAALLANRHVHRAAAARHSAN